MSRELSGKTFRLVGNEHGHASADTIMRFEQTNAPHRATYTGPNVVFGHAIVQDASEQLSMLYHCVDDAGLLSAGQADVYLSSSATGLVNMRLHWEWLTSENVSGVSEWVEIAD